MFKRFTMARKHRSKREREAVCGNSQRAALSVPFGESGELVGSTVARIIAYLPPPSSAQDEITIDYSHAVFAPPFGTAPMRRAFRRWMERTGATWKLADELRLAIEIECDDESMRTLEAEVWYTRLDVAIDAPVPFGARGSGELSQSAGKFAKLNKHQQRERLRGTH